MARKRKTIYKILSGDSDADIRFDDLRKVLLDCGFTERIRGSHHVFRKQGIETLLNLQRDS